MGKKNKKSGEKSVGESSNGGGLLNNLFVVLIIVLSLTNMTALFLNTWRVARGYAVGVAVVNGIKDSASASIGNVVAEIPVVGGIVSNGVAGNTLSEMTKGSLGDSKYGLFLFSYDKGRSVNMWAALEKSQDLISSEVNVYHGAAGELGDTACPSDCQVALSQKKEMYATYSFFGMITAVANFIVSIAALFVGFSYIMHHSKPTKSVVILVIMTPLSIGVNFYWAYITFYVTIRLWTTANYPLPYLGLAWMLSTAANFGILIIALAMKIHGFVTQYILSPSKEDLNDPLLDQTLDLPPPIRGHGEPPSPNRGPPLPLPPSMMVGPSQMTYRASPFPPPK